MNIRHLYYTSSESFRILPVLFQRIHRPFFPGNSFHLDFRSQSPTISRAQTTSGPIRSPSGPHVPDRRHYLGTVGWWPCTIGSQDRLRWKVDVAVVFFFLWKIMHNIYIYTVVWYSHSIVKAYNPSIFGIKIHLINLIPNYFELHWGTRVLPTASMAAFNMTALVFQFLLPFWKVILRNKLVSDVHQDFLRIRMVPWHRTHIFGWLRNSRQVCVTAKTGWISITWWHLQLEIPQILCHLPAVGRHFPQRERRHGVNCSSV